MEARSKRTDEDKEASSKLSRVSSSSSRVDEVEAAPSVVVVVRAPKDWDRERPGRVYSLPPPVMLLAYL